MQKYPKLLIISNECLSKVSSNGRTLRNFLQGWPRDRIAQFHIRNASPDDTACGNFYYVSDGAALRAFLKGKTADGSKQSTASVTQPKPAGSKRNAMTMLVRNLVWNSMRWAGKPFYDWVEAFAPELILLQAGDCAFMLRLARKLARKYQIPLVIYNSEGYYFKKFDYFRSSGFAKLCYPVFYRQFCREFEKTVRMAVCSVYCCDKLKTDYDASLRLPSVVIHTATQMTAAEETVPNAPLRISYLGNLGVGRHESLVQIGNCLQKIAPELKLDVYGKLPNDTVRAAFDGCAGICYKGFVSYEEVVQTMHQSDILVHTENFSDFYKEDLKYAFSTKIADTLASGRCFLLYAPENLACTEYLRKEEAAYVATDLQQLEAVLKEICTDIQSRRKYMENALRLAQKNHNGPQNARRFQDLLCEQVKEQL